MIIVGNYFYVGVFGRFFLVGMVIRIVFKIRIGFLV